LDWTVPPAFARAQTGNRVTLQGNFDPAGLLAPAAQIRERVKTMIDAFGPQRYIVNLDMVFCLPCLWNTHAHL
jgi:uroporphyrinogen decarboxylase